MTPHDFLRWYTFDERVLRGTYFPSSPLDVEEGDRVGVVLLDLGGPQTLDDVKPFLYNRYMDPARLSLPVGHRLRHWLATAAASVRSSSLKEEYELIGGGSPLTRLIREQSDSLERHLTEHYGEPTGVDFRTYVATRYWHPFAEEAGAQMEEEGVDKVVLLPLHPQYAKATTGSAFAYWKALEETGGIPSWPTTTVFEYATNPKFVRALSERVDEGLQRFSREQRSEVQLVFTARGTSAQDVSEWKDPYCCLVHSTVEEVMRHRGYDRPYQTTFQETSPLQTGLSPLTTSALGELAENGSTAVLVVPVSVVADRLETNHTLDIRVREDAEIAGIHHFEVTSALNTHPLFVEALGEATVAQLGMPVDVNQLRVGGDGLSQDYPLRPLDDLPRHEAQPDCPHCDCNGEARQWTAGDNAPETRVVESGSSDTEGPSTDARPSSASEEAE